MKIDMQTDTHTHIALVSELSGSVTEQVPQHRSDNIVFQSQTIEQENNANASKQGKPHTDKEPRLNEGI